MALADDATTFLGDADSSLDTADIASDPDDVPERSKPFLLMGSSLTAIFVAGMTALAIAMVISVQPTADQDPDDMTMLPSAVAPPTASQCAARRAAAVPKTVPAPAPAAPPAAHRDGTAEGSARPAAASIGAQRCARPGGAAPAPPLRRPLWLRAGDTAAGHPVAAHRFFSHPASSTRVRGPAGGGHGGGDGHGGGGMGTAAVT